MDNSIHVIYPNSVPEFNDINLIARAYAHKNKDLGCTMDMAYARIFSWLQEESQRSDPSNWLEMFVWDCFEMGPKGFVQYLKDENIQ